MNNNDNIVDMTIKRVHTQNRMNSINDNSRLINELQLQEEKVKKSSRELFKTSKFYKSVLIFNTIIIVIAMLVAGFSSMKYKTLKNECFPNGQYLKHFSGTNYIFIMELVIKMILK